MSDLPAFEWKYLAEDGTALAIGIVEAVDLLEAIEEVANHQPEPDRDAVKFEIRELGE